MAEVYIITCIDNDKQYVGLTRRGYMNRFTEHFIDAFERESTCVIHKAMRKYGLKKFTIECVYESDDVMMCGIMEQYLINTLKTKAPHGYNSTIGGESALSTKQRTSLNKRRVKQEKWKKCVSNPTDNCRYCGGTFEKVRKWKEFCSITCKNRYHKERREKAMRMLEEQEKEAGN